MSLQLDFEPPVPQQIGSHEILQEVSFAQQPSLLA